MPKRPSPSAAAPSTSASPSMPAPGERAPVIALRGVSMSFAKPSGEPLPVLADIDLAVREGEILGLLGRSGSGKSTLLRIAAGLVKPTSGRVEYRGAPLDGPAAGIGVVFQTFALYPWLTVEENVELGLDAIRVPPDDAHARVTSAIELIGLDGFESAYPRELSGGMRQRVGFARALVGDPALLLMDEPFSALDVLTADTLRTDFLDLWHARQLPIDAVLMVTHNIEEAVLMCDRILVLGAHPGRILAEVPIPLAYPRNRLDPELQHIVDGIYAALTSRLGDALAAPNGKPGVPAQRLPNVSSHRLDSFVDAFVAHTRDGCAELPRLASALAMPVGDLLPLAVALHVLEFAELRDGALRLTAAGRVYAQGDAGERKRLFREHLEHFVALAAHIRQVLDERAGHQAPRERFELELLDRLNPLDAANTLRVAIDWGRFAGLYDYDDDARVFRRGEGSARG
ncbi:nitrate ABC transporter ATP-binding protein [Burkholderia pseudomallei]|nr:nitrate ABC transporter ATP-binding protein [Burkholderia pseudomallei]